MEQVNAESMVIPDKNHPGRWRWEIRLTIGRKPLGVVKAPHGQHWGTEAAAYEYAGRKMEEVLRKMDELRSESP